jgi:hypothetical protein
MKAAQEAAKAAKAGPVKGKKNNIFIQKKHQLQNWCFFFMPNFAVLRNAKSLCRSFYF